jgi:hypothetical protein
VAEVGAEAVVRGQLALHVGLETAAAPLLPVHELLTVLAPVIIKSALQSGSVMDKHSQLYFYLFY